MSNKQSEEEKKPRCSHCSKGEPCFMSKEAYQQWLKEMERIKKEKVSQYIPTSNNPLYSLKSANYNTYTYELVGRPTYNPPSWIGASSILDKPDISKFKYSQKKDKRE